jgi:hypothetical protein
MGEGFGLGDGANDLSGTPGLGESRVSDARRRRSVPVESGRWPSAGTLFRLAGLGFAAIVIAGLLLTAIRS